MFAARKTGGEVGDQHHSKNFPPNVVDTMFDVMREDLLKYFESSPFPFPLPFTIVTDKDESHHRKRLLIGLRLLDFDVDEKEDFVKTIYLAHPPSIDQSGAGIAKTIHDKLVDMGIKTEILGRAYRGLCADGGIINVNLSDHLLQQFWGTSSIPESKRSKVLWVWDGAHIIELILKHSLERHPRIKASKESLESIVKFFREATVYEVLLRKGLACDQRVYSPKVAKDMKFVAHDVTIAHDFMSNFNLFVETLVHVIDHSDKDDMVAKARGHLKLLQDEEFLLDIHLLVAITRVLKRFSTEFQVTLSLKETADYPFSTETFYRNMLR